MFALEIDFHDGVSPPETIYVRRPHAVVGTSDYAHVVIEGSAANLYELRITRGLGREFRCEPITRSDELTAPPPFLEGVYQGEAEINLGDVTTIITSLDADLQIHQGESPDSAGVRILRRVLVQPSPVFPAVAVIGAVPLFVSFPLGEHIVVGRSRRCGLRLDASDVSGEHARIGFEDSRFWIEDLGSTNGTLVGGERIVGRRLLEPEDLISIGAEFTLAGVSSQEEVLTLGSRKTEEKPQLASQQSYPCIVSTSELIRPSRYVLRRETSVTLGRDPANDIWIGAAHVSRNHAEIVCDEHGAVSIIDLSSNGVRLDGELLPRGEPKRLDALVSRFDLNEGVEFSICLSEAGEYESQGAASSEDPINIGTDVQLDVEQGEIPGEFDSSSASSPREGSFGDLLAGMTGPSAESSPGALMNNMEETTLHSFEKLALEARGKELDNEAGSEKNDDFFSALSSSDFSDEQLESVAEESFEEDSAKSGLLRFLARSSLFVLVILLIAVFIWFLSPK